MRMLRSNALWSLTALSLAACANMPTPLPEIASSEVFVTAIRDVCFGSLRQGETYKTLAAEKGFELTEDVSEKFKGTEEEKIYTAGYTSAPILIHIDEAETKCSVTAVRGEYAELKSLSEAEILAFQNLEEDTPEHLAIVESDVQRQYVLKFTLLLGQAPEIQE